jgi:hypothetical protein
MTKCYLTMAYAYTGINGLVRAHSRALIRNSGMAGNPKVIQLGRKVGISDK